MTFSTYMIKKGEYCLKQQYSGIVTCKLRLDGPWKTMGLSLTQSGIDIKDKKMSKRKCSIPFSAIIELDEMERALENSPTDFGFYLKTTNTHYPRICVSTVDNESKMTWIKEINSRKNANKIQEEAKKREKLITNS